MRGGEDMTQWDLVEDGEKYQSRRKPTDVISSASVPPPTPALPVPGLTAVNVRRGQLPGGTKVDADELALHQKDRATLSPVGSHHHGPPGY